jgi:hypothetical protein
MALPGFTAGASLGVVPRGFSALERHAPTINAVLPQGCDVWKAIRCGASVAACTAACLSGVGTAACIGCFAALGASDCIDCLH